MDRPLILEHRRCNELLRDCDGREYASDLVFVQARELKSLILEVKSYRNDPRDKRNATLARQTQKQRDKDKAGVR